MSAQLDRAAVTGTKGTIDLGPHNLKQIDLRRYRGEAEIATLVPDARVSLTSARRDLATAERHLTRIAKEG